MSAPAELIDLIVTTVSNNILLVLTSRLTFISILNSGNDKVSGNSLAITLQIQQRMIVIIHWNHVMNSGAFNYK